MRFIPYSLKRAIWENAWAHTRLWLRSDRIRLWLILHHPAKPRTWMDVAGGYPTWDDMSR